MRLVRFSWLPLVLIALLRASPASAECTAFRPWPEFTKVAPTAKRVVVGTVIEGFDDPGSPRHGAFSMHIDQVLRGSPAADTMRINGLVSPLEPVGYFDCPPDNPLWVRIGWQIAIAFDGRYPGLKGPVTTVAVIKGRPDPDNPKLQKLSYANVVDAAGLPGTDEPPPPLHPVIDLIGNAALWSAPAIGVIGFVGLRGRVKGRRNGKSTALAN